MDDLGPHFRVLAPGDPRLLEGLEGREDGPADPDQILYLFNLIFVPNNFKYT